MEQLIKYPLGIQNFESLRRDGYLYIDKTSIIQELVESGRYYFLSRPRRFGKSLLLSTLRAYYEGKRELFRGLAIDTDKVSWEPHPILYLDLNTERYDAKEKLEDKLNLFLCDAETIYGKNEAERSLGTRFEGVIKRAYEKTGKRVAILVDEYDKPMLQAIGNNDLQNEFRSTLKGFYGALKSMDGCIQFAFLTGVTKFGKVSVFSDLNHLTDISMEASYYDICGITEEEIDVYLKQGVLELAEAYDMTYDECKAKLKERYDGYHFEEKTPGIYNPFSLLKTLCFKKFGSYWFETGTPTYLATLLKLHDYNLAEMASTETTAKVLNSIDANSTNPIPVIYQSGYLTIKDYDDEFGIYTLGFPNKEVEEGFLDYLIPYYSRVDAVDSATEIHGTAKEALQQIQDKNYTLPFEMNGQKIIRIGMNFSSQTRNIDGVEIEE